MSAMLLSIKPEYAKVILEEKKQYEFRKSRPKDSVDRIIFYASAPQKEVVGEALIDEILEGTPKEIRETAKTAAGITKKFYFSYYSGKDKAIAYKLNRNFLNLGIIESRNYIRISYGSFLYAGTNGISPFS